MNFVHEFYVQKQNVFNLKKIFQMLGYNEEALKNQ